MNTHNLPPTDPEPSAPERVAIGRLVDYRLDPIRDVAVAHCGACRRELDAKPLPPAPFPLRQFWPHPIRHMCDVRLEGDR